MNRHRSEKTDNCSDWIFVKSDRAVRKLRHKKGIEMTAANKLNVIQEDPNSYPSIVSGMKAADRRLAVTWLRENLPGFQWSNEFEAHNAAKHILNQPDDLQTNVRRKPVSGGKDLARYFGESARLPLLTQEEEVFYFRRMNFVRWRAEQSLENINESRPSFRALSQIVADLKQGDEDRNLLAEHNLRLVIPLAHRFYLRSESVWDYISEGNAALLRAIRGFDYSRGFRFSTYATWAIMNSLQRLAGKQNRDFKRFSPTDVGIFESLAGEVESATAENQRVSVARERLSSLLEVLDQRTRSIVVMRYGIGDGAEPMSLREVGEHFGVSKERVRQIEMKALSSMMAAEQQSVALQA